MMSESGLLLVVMGMGVITYGLRAGSLLLAERLPRSLWLISFLRFVPVAVLSAIIAMELLTPGGTLSLSPLANPRLVAGVLAILVAWRTRRILPTVLIGLISLWILQASVADLILR
jgi:branched-subunit amino acid transport protein